MPKIKLSEENKSKTLSNFLALAGAIIFYMLASNFSNFMNSFWNFFGIMSPFVYGFVLAYLLNTPMKYIERFYEKVIIKKESHKNRKGLVRGLSIISTLILALLLLTGLMAILVPQLINSVSLFVQNLPDYVANVNEMANQISSKINFQSEAVKNILSMWDTLVKKMLQVLGTILPGLLTGILSFSGQIIDVVMGIIVAIYFLGSKEKFAAQIKKILISAFPDKVTSYIFNKGKMVNHMFSRYISGQLLDAVALGCVCFLLMSIFKMPYALLVSVIVAVTNVIPMVGPFIGAIPSIFIISMVSFPKALGFAVLVLVLQQIDGNILAPKIVGDSTGLSGFWVFLAIFIGGALFGIVGIIIGVPTMGVIYNIIKEIVEIRLEKKNKPVETENYL